MDTIVLPLKTCQRKDAIGFCVTKARMTWPVAVCETKDGSVYFYKSTRIPCDTSAVIYKSEDDRLKGQLFNRNVDTIVLSLTDDALTINTNGPEAEAIVTNIANSPIWKTVSTRLATVPFK